MAPYPLGEAFAEPRFLFANHRYVGVRVNCRALRGLCRRNELNRKQRLLVAKLLIQLVEIASQGVCGGRKFVACSLKLMSQCGKLIA